MIELPKSSSVDILLVSEGTYPYVRGGVSSWISQLISGLSQFTFGVIFIGSRREDYRGVLYEFPPNLKHLEVHYLFDQIEYLPKKRAGDRLAFNQIREFYSSIESKDIDFPESMRDIDFFINRISQEDFLYSKESWNFMQECYKKNCPHLPFIDYFWTLRNIHSPIWKIAKIVKNMPKAKIIHAPSTGYAGFLSSLASYDRDIPFLLTEHGIYTRERKIDLLSAKWISYQVPTLLQDQPQEMNYIKKMWVGFFEKIALLSYNRAESIISLYPGARDIQISYGADKKKSIVIPNGVDIKRFNALIDKRGNKIPKVVTLIGRVVSIKDIKTFIRAIAIVKRTIPQIEGWIVGDLDEEPKYADECYELVKSFDLNDSVLFLGFKNIDEILPKTALLTLTSISEGMPLVVLEGFASGIPCIATDVGSCRDLIYGALDDEDIAIGKAGEVTTIANPEALAESYIHYLSSKKSYRSAQNNGLKRVLKYYKESTFLDNYRDIYERLL